MHPVRSALFLDFDNIFGGLLELDRDAGVSFAREPSKWLDRLQEQHLDYGGPRRFLQLRAYLNPAGSILDEQLGNDSGRLFLQKFRPNLTRAGFEVVDCPALNRHQKNAADIRIVIDTLTSLESGNPIDEVIIASGDADFTPLLHQLRARDRRTVIMSATDVSPAYEAVADDVIEPEALIALVVASDATPASVSTNGDGKAGAERIIRNLLSTSHEPVLLAHVGNAVRRQLQTEVERTDWFECGGLAAFARSLTNEDDLPFETDSYHLWDPTRHDPPATDHPENRHDLPPIIHDLRTTADLPALPSSTWPALFRALADYAATEVFNLNVCTAKVRDALADTSTPASRNVVGHVVKATLAGGVRLDNHPPPGPDEIRTAFRDSVIDRHELGGMQLDEAERALLDRWLQGESSTDPG